MKGVTSEYVPLLTSVPRSRAEWELEDGVTMPESTRHDRILVLLHSIFTAWIERTGRDASVERNRAVRWDRSRPKVGVDPDIALFSPPPPEGEDTVSVKTWCEGHTPPLLAIEVVSTTHPTKDYGASPEKYAANETGELWVFDPELAGPKSAGGPFLLQLWVRSEGVFTRTYAGDGPVRSPVLGAWIVVTDGRRRLRVADDPEGNALWPTEADAERAEKERERSANAAATARIAELEAMLSQRNK